MKKSAFTPFNTFGRRCLCLLVLLTISGYNLYAQVNYKATGTVKVAGKSNVHDWEMTAQNIVCEAGFSQAAADELPKALTSLSFSVNAKNLKSKNESMDNRTYKAIKADTYPQITFKLAEATLTPGQKNKCSIKASGKLTIAGVTKLINLNVDAELKADNTIQCTGEEKILLTDYNIQPPSFMLGAMKVGNELTISYNLNFKK